MEKLAKDYKKFVATIYLTGNICVKSIGNKEEVSVDPYKLAKYYEDNSADELLIFDLSRSEEEHEDALLWIKKICMNLDIPVVVAGNIKTLDDASKLLGLGCRQIVLNYAKESNTLMTKELAQKYGSESIVAAITNAEIFFENKDLIEKNVCELLIMQDECTIKLLKKTFIPMIVPLADIPLERLIDYLDKDIISGILGTVVNANISELSGIKMICRERGIRTYCFEPQLKWSDLKTNSDGLVPCIVQDYKTNEVLMMAYMNEEAFDTTIKTGRMNYYSRSRKSQWLKGETSGHFQYVKSLHADCDSDTLVAKISQVGAACHTGSRSCFFKEIVSRKYI